MAKKDEAKITFNADTKEFNEQISKASSTMTELGSELKLVEAKMKNNGKTVEDLEEKERILAKQQEQLAAKTQALESKYEAAVRIWGKGSTEAQKLATQVNNAKTAEERLKGDVARCNAELQEARTKMSNAESSARDLAKGLDDASDSARDMSSSIGDIAAGNIIADVATSAISSLAGLEESTRQYRNEQNKLEAIALTSGQSIEELKSQYSDLYAITGDETLSATAVSNLSAMGLSVEESSRLIHAATGIWARYGDSIPLDGLMESINESSRAGQVTGNLADALNWASFENVTFGVTMKDNIEFTELSKKEYEKLTEAQKEQYDAQKEQYEAIEDWNEAVAEAVSAEDRFNLALQQCSTEEERQQLIVNTLNGKYGNLAYAYEDNNEAVMDMNRSNEKMMDSQSKLAEKIAPLQALVTGLAADGIGFLADNLEIIAPIAIAAGVAFGILAVAVNFTAIVQALSGALGVLNLVMGLNPAILIAAGLVVLVTAFATLWEHCEGFRNFWIGLWDAICETANTAKENFMAVIDTIAAAFGFEIEWPKIPMPHFSISPSGWKIGDLLKGSIPSLSIEWYAKAMDNGMILNSPTIFGMSGGKLLAGGEAGSEVVVGTNSLMRMIQSAVNTTGGSVNATFNIDAKNMTADEVEAIVYRKLSRAQAAMGR